MLGKSRLGKAFYSISQHKFMKKTNNNFKEFPGTHILECFVVQSRQHLVVLIFNKMQMSAAVLYSVN